MADTKSHGICADPEQQLMEDRICSWVVSCPLIGLLRQQHFIPQPEFAITPVAIKPPPKVRVKAMQMALMSILFLEAPLFIVNQYTLSDFGVSIDNNQIIALTKAIKTKANTLYKDVDRIYIYTKMRSN
jgi:hypothetical protein